MTAILAIEGKIIWLATCSGTKENSSYVPLRTATGSLLSRETWNGMWRNFMMRTLMTLTCKSSTYARNVERNLSLHQSWGSMKIHTVSDLGSQFVFYKILCLGEVLLLLLLFPIHWTAGGGEALRPTGPRTDPWAIHWNWDAVCWHH